MQKWAVTKQEDEFVPHFIKHLLAVDSSAAVFFFLVFLVYFVLLVSLIKDDFCFSARLRPGGTNTTSSAYSRTLMLLI